MLYYCEECKMIIREEDLDHQEEYQGEAWGHDVSRDIWVCPCCGEIPEEYVEPYIDDDYDGEEPEIPPTYGEDVF